MAAFSYPNAHKQK